MQYFLADGASIFERGEKESLRHHLRMLWHGADYFPVCFISIDLEGPFKHITELGLAFQRKNQPRMGRHLVVQSTQHEKSRPPLPLGFGMTSETIDEPEQLDSGPPIDTPILDSATIFKTFTGRNRHPTLGKTLELFGYDGLPSAPFHNAANDAWYALELLFREADQAWKQVMHPDGEDTIDWMVTPGGPPNSPTRGTTAQQAYDRCLSIPTLPCPSMGKASARNLSGQAPPTPQTPQDDSTSLGKNRRKIRKRVRTETSTDDNMTNSTSAVNPTGSSPPAKKRKTTHERSITEEEQGETNCVKADERNHNDEGGLAGKAEAEGQEDMVGQEEVKEVQKGSVEGELSVTSGAP
ncbi:hypothetical protein J7T55_013886 [Diaporthe amygdali]|uniref:uncharacterized protein n=1 Tax=Phomopsis amygdali TaxID=1214568 RepID=UPI0022FE717F|nr:uncharacterized protein J7T55_013886 [Diaporthe amygdali]KAJ0119683.1 hypothetical protein J7T55_013886 [Diaporthe amygdali]